MIFEELKQQMMTAFILKHFNLIRKNYSENKLLKLCK